MYLLLPVLFIILIYVNYRVIYKVTTENIEYRAKSTLLQYSAELDDFLTPGIRILESMSYNIEDMFRTNTSNKEILDFLVRETDELETLTNIETTGIYGCIKGEYLDGSLWVPDEGFIPEERPWYKEARAKQGKLTYVEPYVDMMTGDKIVTICQLLSDGKSVVGIDIKINQIQDVTEKLISKDDDASAVIVLDDDGCVVAHSDPGELGKNYLEEIYDPSAVIAQKLLISNKMDFTLDYEGSRYIVYAMDLGGGWYILSVTRAQKMFARVFTAFFISVLAGLIGTLLIFYILFTINRRRIEAEKYNSDLKSVSSIYLLMYKINLQEDTFEEISCLSDKITNMIGEKRWEARNLMRNIVILRSDDRSREEILNFTDFNTLSERLGNSNTITCEFMNPEKEWNRARFVVVERDNDGTLLSVLFMVETIDEEKKARDRLLYLSETDSMTGINNRGSGENKVRKLLLDGDGGMFMLLDVDKFKSINDTYGHAAGDKVLISIAECMRRAFRNNDVMMRLGGDEFAAFAPM
ncbi:MAG: diguanylate cyclase, partial [Lachnospiraceae bacterium]|nr:diguanylate cyclase [Lachnospiraceae bacterium]